MKTIRKHGTGTYRRQPFYLPPEHVALLGTASDRVIAERLNLKVSRVTTERKRRGISSYHGEKGWIDQNGYVRVVIPQDHPLRGMGGRRGEVQQHRLVMAKALGRPLERDEFVHHLNGDKADNRLENLELWTRSHPDGQRVEDKLAWAREFIARYADPLEP